MADAQGFSCGIWQFEKSVKNFDLLLLPNGSNDPSFQEDKNWHLGIFFDLFFQDVEWNGMNVEVSALLQRLLPVGWVFSVVPPSPHCVFLN